MKNSNENQEHVNELTETFEGYFEHKDNSDTALVLVMKMSEGSEGVSGYGVGIATRHIKGYTPTPVNVYLGNYKQAEDVVHKANEVLFKRSELDSYKIVISTMRG